LGQGQLANVFCALRSLLKNAKSSLELGNTEHLSDNVKSCNEYTRLQRVLNDFSPSCDLAPHPTPLSRQQVVSPPQSSCVSPIELADWKGGGGGVGAKLYDVEKAYFSIIIQYSLLPCAQECWLKLSFDTPLFKTIICNKLKK
jgi:hypothetical protein